MLVIVEQALGDVERSEAAAPDLFGEGEDKFMAGTALGGRRQAAGGSA